MEMVKSPAPAFPKVEENTVSMSAVPFNSSPPASVCPNTPLVAIANPVNVQITIVSMNTPVILIYPCRTGSCVSAQAALIPAAPSPASLENTPLETPYLIAALAE